VSVHLGFIVVRVALRHGFLRAFRFLRCQYYSTMATYSCSPYQGSRTFLKACAQILRNFRRNSFEYHGNFEQQNGVLESCIIIIDYYIIYYCYCKNYCRVREGTKQLKVFLGSLFRQPVTSHGFWFFINKLFTRSIILQ
jgi:hypothetical protein